MIVPERRVDIPRNALVISEYTPDAPGHQFTVFAVHGSREDMGMWDRRQRDSCNCNEPGRQHGYRFLQRYSKQFGTCWFAPVDIVRQFVSRTQTARGRHVMLVPRPSHGPTIFSNSLFHLALGCDTSLSTFLRFASRGTRHKAASHETCGKAAFR